MEDSKVEVTILTYREQRFPLFLEPKEFEQLKARLDSFDWFKGKDFQGNDVYVNLQRLAAIRKEA